MEAHVYFRVKLTASNKEKLYELSEKLGEKMSLCAGKTVHPHSYQEV